MVQFSSLQKAIKLKDGLISLSNTGIEMAEKMQEIFAAQRKLAELITSETVPNSNTASNDQLYAGTFWQTDMYI